jgi:uncharacterized protein YggL (DUF469 family)
MNKEITEQTDSLESIIREVSKLNGLVYAGWSLESMSRFVTKDNVEEMRKKRKAGVLIKDLMKEYGLSKASVYRLMAS